MLPTNTLSRLVLAGLAAGCLACGHDNLVLPNEGDASTITIVSGDSQNGESGAVLAQELVVSITDELHRPVVGQAVAFAPVSEANGQVSDEAVVTDAEGHATTQWVLGPGVGNQQVRASVVVNGSPSSKLWVTFNATAAAGAAARLVFVAQPSDIGAGVAIDPPVKVEVQDQNGNRVTDATTPVTLALGNNPAAGTLSGGGAVSAVGGIATFANVSLNRSGMGYTLTAAATGFSPATSIAFDVAAGAPHHLEFSVPSSARAGTTITPAQVTVRDALANVVTSPAISITVAIQDNPASGTLSGTKTVATVNGVATFSNLAIDRAGDNYTLRASGGGLEIESPTLDVLPGNVNGLAFVTSPSGSVTGGPLGTIQVRVLDAEGNLVTTATNSISINSSVVGTLSGTNTASAVGGVATFSNLAITKAGADYRLVAHTSGLVDATSDAFTVAKASTTISITSKSPSGTSTVGQALRVNYDVNIVAPGAGSLTGSVEVSDGETSCIGGITSSGTGNCSLTFASTGTRTLTARYLGDVNFQGSTSTGTSHTVNKGATTLSLTSDTPDPSQAGEAVVVGWTVTGPVDGPTPTGTVTVTIAGGGDDASCSAPVVAGSCTITPTVPGTISLSGSYTGDDNYNGDTDTRGHVVSKAATTTTITSITAGSAVLLPDVTVAFSVTSATTTSPTGNVIVTVNGTQRCNVAVGAGSCTIASIVFILPGTYNVVATYQGDATHATSSDTKQYNVANIAPEATNDAYSVTEDATLNVDASGVLQNDTDAQGQELSAVLVDGPSHAAPDGFTLHADGSFSYKPAADFNGSDSFTYRASDGQSQSSVATVTITVDAANDAPSFTKGTNTSAAADAGPQTIPGWATGISAGPADEAGQLVTFEVVDIASSESLFASGGEPVIASDGTLTFAPEPTSAGGTATVTVRLTDNGGTANGGQDTSATQTFTITILSPS